MTSGPSGQLSVGLVGTGAIEIPPPAYGAVEEYIANLARELSALGHEVAVINPRPGFGPSRWQEVASAASLPAKLRGARFDVLHAHSPITTEALLLSGRGYVLTSHSRYWRSEVRGRDRLWLARDRLAVRRAEAVVALTPQVLPTFRSLRGGRDPESVRVVPFGVDVDRFRPPPDGSDRAGAIGLGVVAAHKRFDILAAATRRAGLAARVIGRIADPAAREAARRQNPELTFVGEVSREALPIELARARVFVHPSDMELASVATVQAMACGLPVVGSDLLEGIVTPGVDGFLVPHAAPFEERVQRTADHLRRLSEEPELWRDMSMAARAAAVEEHAWPAIARRVAEFYARVVSARA